MEDQGHPGGQIEMLDTRTHSLTHSQTLLLIHPPRIDLDNFSLQSHQLVRFEHPSAKQTIQNFRHPLGGGVAMVVVSEGDGGDDG